MKTVFCQPGNYSFGREETQHITSGLAKLGCKVTTRTSVCPLTVSDSPNGVQSIPNFAKPLRCYVLCFLSPETVISRLTKNSFH